MSEKNKPQSKPTIADGFRDIMQMFQNKKPDPPRWFFDYKHLPGVTASISMLMTSISILPEKELFAASTEENQLRDFYEEFMIAYSDTIDAIIDSTIYDAAYPSADSSRPDLEQIKEELQSPIRELQIQCVNEPLRNSEHRKRIEQQLNRIENTFNQLVELEKIDHPNRRANLARVDPDKFYVLAPRGHDGFTKDAVKHANESVRVAVKYMEESQTNFHIREADRVTKELVSSIGRLKIHCDDLLTEDNPLSRQLERNQSRINELFVWLVEDSGPR